MSTDFRYIATVCTKRSLNFLDRILRLDDRSLFGNATNNNERIRKGEPAILQNTGFSKYVCLDRPKSYIK